MSLKTALGLIGLGLALGGCSGADLTPRGATSPSPVAIASASPVKPSPIQGCRPRPQSHPSIHPLEGAPPFPEESLWVQHESSFGEERLTGAVHESIDQLRGRVTTLWPSQRWVEITAETEPGFEVEGRWKRDSVMFFFRGRNLYCDPTWTHCGLGDHALISWEA